MSNDLHISYRPLPTATPESELEALAAVYSFLIRSHENRKAAATGGGDDQEIGGENNRTPGSPSGSGGSRLPVYRDEYVGEKQSPARKEAITE